MRRGAIQSCVVVALCSALAGCGDAGRRVAVTPSVSGVETIRSWSEALTRSDLAGASALFAIPSLAQIDPAGPVGRITKPAQARALAAALPCGAKLLDVHPRGRYVDALFLLTERPGVSCVGTGGTARVAFRIGSGKIVEWRRIADEPGDAARGNAPQPSPQQPAPGQPGPGNPTTTPSPQVRSV